MVASSDIFLRPSRMGFGSLQIDDGALMVMGEHVEVQMRLVEGPLGVLNTCHFLLSALKGVYHWTYLVVASFWVF